jgi:hypothetical protein
MEPQKTTKGCNLKSTDELTNDEAYTLQLGYDRMLAALKVALPVIEKAKDMLGQWGTFYDAFVAVKVAIDMANKENVRPQPASLITTTK